MRKSIFFRLHPVLLILIFGAIASSTAFGNATITIQNNDAAGTGFNDNTPAAPVGGNAGTTVGQQRLNAFTFVPGRRSPVVPSPLKSIGLTYALNGG